MISNRLKCDVALQEPIFPLEELPLLIIIAGVVLETMDQIEAVVKSHHYEGFLISSRKKPLYRIPKFYEHIEEGAYSV